MGIADDLARDNYLDLSGTLLISADSHVTEPEDLWQTRLPAALRDRAPQFPARRQGAGHSEGTLNESRPGGADPDLRLGEMSQDGVSAEVLFPTLGLRLFAMEDAPLQEACFRVYNDWLIEYCSVAPDRLFGIGYCPMYDVDFAIEQMRTAASVGLKGVVIPAFPQTQVASGGIGTGGQLLALGGDPSGSRTYADAEFNPFWEASIDLNMPVHMHLGARSTRLTPERFIVDMVMTKLTMAEPIAYLVFGGVLQRYPDLKFVSVESGVGWFAFVGHYMDHLWQKHRYWTNSTLIEVPSFYMDRQVYGTFLDDPIGVALRQHAGAKNIMWSSDYPHSETTFPNSLGMIADNFKGVPEADKQRMICGTAMELYGITSG